MPISYLPGAALIVLANSAQPSRTHSPSLTADTALSLNASTLSLNASTLSLNASTLSNAGLLMAGKPAPGQGPNANYLDSLSAPGATVGQLQLNIDGALTNSGQIAATGDITARSANLNTPSGSSLAIWR